MYTRHKEPEARSQDTATLHQGYLSTQRPDHAVRRVLDASTADPHTISTHHRLQLSHRHTTPIPVSTDCSLDT